MSHALVVLDVNVDAHGTQLFRERRGFRGEQVLLGDTDPGFGRLGQQVRGSEVGGGIPVESIVFVCQVHVAVPRHAGRGKPGSVYAS